MFLPPTTLLTLVFAVFPCSCLGAGDQVVYRGDREHSGYEPILDDDFAAWIKETGNRLGMKGIAVAVTRKNKDEEGWTTETKGYGVADRWGNPVDEETLFSIGSNSKLFTALGVGLLTTNESIPMDWDTKIKDILPKTLWTLRDPIAQEHANLVDILSHRTGLPRHDLSYSLTDTPEKSLAKLRYLRPSTEFRETWQYNNQMYTLAAYIISRTTGLPFSTFITNNIISPLRMTFTTYNVTHALQSGKLAEGFLRTGSDEEKGGRTQKTTFQPIPFWLKDGGAELIAGAGGVISNARDMAIWLQTLLLSGKSPETGEHVVPASVVDKVARGMMVAVDQAPEPELSPIVYGMGQERYTYQGHELIEHNGGTVGHYSIVTRAPHDNLGIAVLINTDGGDSLLNMIKWRLLEKSLGLKQIDWNERFTWPEQRPEARNSTRIHSPTDGTSSPLPAHDLAGIYFNPAYGALTLCLPPSSPHYQPSRKECEGVVSDAIKPLLNDSANPPSLLAAWPKFWSSHLLLHHVSGNKFDVVPVLTFPAPFADDDSRPFAIRTGLASAEFVLANNAGKAVDRVEGVACRDAWGAGSNVKELKGEGREGAEVWFDRVV